ncbi:MAG TPA: homoserine O-acetyltransferase [Chryseosolibacter sp.]|nr:homoserine O-acetyltransferase [Chryseosolibacter sp.]
MLKTDHTFHFNDELQLESGEKLSSFQLKFTTVGNLNEERTNAVWVCHALTGSSDFTDWWGGLFSPDGPFDPAKYFIICANILGGCYGSTGPLSNMPNSNRAYYHDFPVLTNRDVVRAFDLLRLELKIRKIHAIIGGSLGGQQVLEWAIIQPQIFEHIIPIACNAFHSPWGIAFNEAQRLAIEADPTWKENHARAGMEGLKAARAMGMISYRHYNTYGETQSEKTTEKTDEFRAATYQRYQGEKLANRFNAFTYWLLSKMMDSHNVGRNREGVDAALKQIQAKALIIGIESDILFPLSEQQYLLQHIPQATLEVITSIYGHDGFLVEFDQLKKIITHYFNKSFSKVLV